MLSLLDTWPHPFWKTAFSLTFLMIISMVLLEEATLRVISWWFVFHLTCCHLFYLSVNWDLLRVAFSAALTPSFWNCKFSVVISSTSLGPRYNLYAKHFPTCNFEPNLSHELCSLFIQQMAHKFLKCHMSTLEISFKNALPPAFQHIWSVTTALILPEKVLSNPSPCLYVYLCVLL